MNFVLIKKTCIQDLETNLWIGMKTFDRVKHLKIHYQIKFHHILCNTRFFLYKHKVHKHAQPQIGRTLSTLLSTARASDLVVDIKIY